MNKLTINIEKCTETNLWVGNCTELSGLHSQAATIKELFENLAEVIDLMEKSKLDRITINTNICDGEPCIRDTRITVSMVSKLLANGKSHSEVLEAYPELELEDIEQVLIFNA